MNFGEVVIVQRVCRPIYKCKPQPSSYHTADSVHQRGKTKEAPEVMMPPTDAAKVLPNPAFYALGSHLCVARYPKGTTKVHINSETAKSMVYFYQKS